MSSGSGLRPGWGEVKTENGRISYLVSGADHGGTPLVLLPSLGGSASHWGAFGRRLAAERRTIAIDPPGFGRSSAAPGWLSIRGLAEQLLTALDQLALHRFHLFGCSLGALLATRLALLAPERSEALLLASAAARGRDFAPRRPARALRLARDFLTSPYPKPAIARDISGSGSEAAQPPVADPHWSRARLVRYLGAVLSHDVSLELAQLRMPVLVLYGEKDVLLSKAAQQRLTAGMAQAELRALPGAGHDLVNEAPEACAAAVLQFLRER